MKVSYDLEALLQNLSKHLNMEIDPRFEIGLTLNIDNNYKIQLEFLEDRILISSKLGEILLSRYRHQVFEDCLKANFKSSEFGALGYNDKQKMLILALNYPITPPVEQELFYLLDGFILKTKAWVEALKSSNTRLLV